MTQRKFRNIDEYSFNRTALDRFYLDDDWQLWETAWLYRLSSILDYPTVPARMMTKGCDIGGGTINCQVACNSSKLMFGSPETLWNCLTLATVAMRTTGSNAPDNISEKAEADVRATFDTGPLNQFHRFGTFRRYSKCALQSCSDSKFGGCPAELWRFQCNTLNRATLPTLAKAMSQDYCSKADPGIDYDIAGPGIIVAYLIQFAIVFLFALLFKVTKTWVRNVTLVSLLPRHGPKKATEIALAWQRKLSRSTFGMAVSSTIMDLQEAQAVFLATISVATIITFYDSNPAGLGNVSSLLSWLTNNLILRAHSRWWYTLLFVVANWIFVLVITRPQSADAKALSQHFQEAASLAHCGGNPGPRTYCQTFNMPSNTDNSEDELFYLDRDAKSIFEINSRIQAPIHIIVVFLVLDWTFKIVRVQWLERETWLSQKVEGWMNGLPADLRSFIEQKHYLVVKEAVWIMMEVLAVVMAAIGVYEFTAFMHLLSGGKSGKRSDIAISKWAFGQLVAVCVWLPVVLKFASLNIDGVLPGLQRRMSEYIEVIRRKDKRSPNGDNIGLDTSPFLRSADRNSNDFRARAE
ncbi:hypothetical protein FALBO_14438 [Fusarium albosuccineum]|uniref:Uncharacterized protein n=1 Tax=Fusarium albosuccineum TaxID=1237068 RepID=A0A8H4L0G8_9HYPO|nr:hypothetical protein FALBO_14438 [Fusarium albosuccineum]